jgi:predicted thioredoxin/glutaredoxin
MKTVRIYKMQGCKPCEMLSEALENLDKYEGKLEMIDTSLTDDVEDNIKGVPCIIYLLDGKEQKRDVGYGIYTITSIVDWIYN